MSIFMYVTLKEKKKISVLLIAEKGRLDTLWECGGVTDAGCFDATSLLFVLHQIAHCTYLEVSTLGCTAL